VNLRERGGDLVAGVGELVTRSRDQVEKLNKEIALERLLGRLSPGDLSPAQRLLKRRQAHLKLLEAIAREPGKHDLQAMRDEHAAQHSMVSGLFATIQGQAAVLIAEGRAERWKTEFEERSRAQIFETELLGYRAAPDLYRLDKYLSVLAEGLKGKRKYVVGVDRNRVEVWMDTAARGQSISDLRFGAEDK